MAKRKIHQRKFSHCGNYCERAIEDRKRNMAAQIVREISIQELETIFDIFEGTGPDGFPQIIVELHTKVE